MIELELPEGKRDRWRLLRPERFAWIDSGGHWLVCESNQAGKAELKIVLPAGHIGGIGLRLAGESAFAILRDAVDSDGALAYRSADGKWHAAAVELKRTVNAGQLERPRRQLAAGLVRLQIVLDFLGIAPTTWTAILACAQVTEAGSGLTDPVRLHRPVGSSSRPQVGPVEVAECGILAQFRLEPVLLETGPAGAIGGVAL